MVACTTHEAGHDIFDKPGPTVPRPVQRRGGDGGCRYRGDKVSATSQFDGWGYAHLFKNEAGKQTRIDSYAVEESLDERYAVGFGDLSIHEHAPDPLADMSYIAYYAAGARAISYSDQGITETGAYIDQGGNNFWGVEYVGESADGKPLLAFSDRDYGLYVLKYTGPRQGYVAPAQPPRAAGRDEGRDRSDDLAALEPAPEPEDPAHERAQVPNPRQRGSQARRHVARTLHQHPQAGRARKGAEAQGDQRHQRRVPVRR